MPAPAADLLIEDVPIPTDTEIVAPSDASETIKRFSGAWVGSWGTQLHHILVVESLAADGEARVVFAFGDNAASGEKGQWRRHRATVSGDLLTIGAFATYKLLPPGNLRATYSSGGLISHGRLSKIALADLTRPKATIPWTNPGAFLDTTLQEGGKPVKLEVVIEMPAGQGPFPLLVFNHGSTSTGTEPQRFTETWWIPSIAHFFVEKGWMVAFPQRRGRGKSDGLYDEGFAPDRTQGYSGDPDRSLAGADRALDDLGAAIAALQRRPDVAGGPVLIGGQSRGGVLSVVFAGMHPEQVMGVLNFAGGWTGDWRSTAGEINGTLFRRGGMFPRPTLWLYGRGDSYYSIEHSRSNFDAFMKAGGKGEFVEFDVPDGLGHRVIDYPNLWVEPVERYLIAVAAPRSR